MGRRSRLPRDRSTNARAPSSRRSAQTRSGSRRRATRRRESMPRRCQNYARVDLREIARLRLRNQRLVLGGPKFATPEQVVGWFGAVQSQEYAPAKWSVGQRLAGRGGQAGPGGQAARES